MSRGLSIIWPIMAVSPSDAGWAGLICCGSCPGGRRGKRPSIIRLQGQSEKAHNGAEVATRYALHGPWPLTKTGHLGLPFCRALFLPETLPQSFGKLGVPALELA